MTSFLFLALHALLLQFTYCLSLPSSASGPYNQLSRRGDERNVYVIADTRPNTRLTFPDGTDGFFVHSSIYYGGTAVNGPIKVEIGINPEIAPLLTEGGFHLRILELPVSENGKVPSAEGSRQVFKVGTTQMTNLDLFDINKMEGFLTTEFFQDNRYRVGTSFAGDINDCNTFVKYTCGAMGIGLPQELTTLYEGADKWQGKQGNVDIKIVRIALIPAGQSKPTVINLLPDEGCAKKMKRAGSCAPKLQNGGEKGGTFYDDLAANPAYKDNPSQMTDLSTQDSLVKPPSTGMPPNSDTQVTVARAAGKLSTLTAIGKEALNALGIAGTIVGAAFVILDFINHDWVGGAIGAVGLAAGIAAGALVTGPLGWIVGGAIAALFAILPGLFQDQHPPAKKDDIQGILQWKMFGDASHTGNEQCQKGTADVPGNPDCQALYGSGTLSTVLGFNNFDAIAFLIQFNDGYPMSIKDMAANFAVIDDKVDGSSSDKIATIKCNNKRCTQAGRAGCIGGDPGNVCANPTFAINRDLITLPKINAKASDVYNRVIPNPGGDCKLLAYPGTQNFKIYGLSITGSPVSIACGLTGGDDQNGVSLPVGGESSGSGNSGTSTSSATAPSPTPTSTDGQGGAVVPAPPEAPFTPLSNKDYTCLTYNGGFLCLPPGTYQKQSGVGFETKSCDTLTLPEGGFQLESYWKEAPMYRSPRPQGYVIHNYTQNQSPPPDSKTFYPFASDMQAIDTNRDGEAKFIITGPSTGPDPVCCLYSETNFGGNVWCGGIGGGPLTPQWQNIAQSAKCFNGGNMWIYADSYGDKGGAVIKGETPELKSVPYGDTDNFSKKVKAAWILKGS